MIATSPIHFNIYLDLDPFEITITQTVDVYVNIASASILNTYSHSSIHDDVDIY